MEAAEATATTLTAEKLVKLHALMLVVKLNHKGQ
jgi:hypothetical protein